MTGKDFLDLDTLYALEYFRNLQRDGSQNTSALSPKNISAFYNEMGSLNKTRNFSLSIAVYKNLNKFVAAEEATLKQSGIAYNFRIDEGNNVFLKIPTGNQELNSLVLASTVAGLAVGVCVILFVVFKKLKK